MNFIFKEKIEIGLVKINRAYNKVQEPKRFLIVVAILLIGLLTISFGEMVEHSGFMILGMLWFAFVIALRGWVIYVLSERYPYVGKKK